MHVLPELPFDKTARDWVDFCLDFRTETGFIAVFEGNLQKLGGHKKHMGTAYEATEQLHEKLFGRRKYRDREVFYSARSRFYAKSK